MILNNSSDEKIHGDLYILFRVLKELIIYILLLIPYLFLFLIYLFTGSKKKSDYFSKIFLEPFKIIKELMDWFFEAKSTVYLIFILIFVFLLQIFILPDFGNFFATHPNDLFSTKFYSILTSIFFHGSLSHLFSNLFVLLVFGRIVERHIGSKIYFIFVLGGIIANFVSHLISIFFSNSFSSWGASGAISALVILGIFLEPFAISFFLFPSFIIGWFFVLGDISGLFLDDGINQFAHLGGYLAVMILVYFLEKKEKVKVRNGFIINILLIILSYFLILNKEFLLNLF